MTEKEEAVKVSKEVKKLREFEQGLLRNYELYLKDLDSALTSKACRIRSTRDEHGPLNYTFNIREKEGLRRRKVIGPRSCKMSVRIVDDKDIL